jgi:hypothetical protein
MVAFMLESLVLRGSVRMDVLAVGLRLGISANANPQASGIRNSMRHPSPGYRKPDGQSEATPVVVDSTKGILPGAGRSRRHPGSHVLPGAARTTSRLTTLWQPAFGGTTAAVAANCRALSADLVALASEDSTLRLAARQVEALRTESVSVRQAFELSVPPSWRKPAGRTPPVSMREKEGR